jgi:hypothetical protein
MKFSSAWRTFLDGADDDDEDEDEDEDDDLDCDMMLYLFVNLLGVCCSVLGATMFMSCVR